MTRKISASFRVTVIDAERDSYLSFDTYVY